MGCANLWTKLRPLHSILWSSPIGTQFLVRLASLDQRAEGSGQAGDGSRFSRSSADTSIVAMTPCSAIGNGCSCRNGRLTFLSCSTKPLCSRSSSIVNDVQQLAPRTTKLYDRTKDENYAERGGANGSQRLRTSMPRLSAGNLCRSAGAINTPQGCAVRCRVPCDIEIHSFAVIQRKLRIR
jgi:hypothetical protein